MVDMAEKMNETYWPNNVTKLRIQPTEIAHVYHYGAGVFGSGFHITVPYREMAGACQQGPSVEKCQ